MPKGIKYIRAEYSTRELTQWLCLLKFRCRYPTFESLSYASYATIARTVYISATTARSFILAELKRNEELKKGKQMTTRSITKKRALAASKLRKITPPILNYIIDPETVL